MVAIEREKARIKAQKTKEQNGAKKKKKKKKAAENKQTRKPTGLRLTKAMPSTSLDHVNDK